MDLSDKTLIATLIDSNNNSTPKIIEGKNLEAGKAYNLPEKTKVDIDINVSTMGTLSSILNQTQKNTITAMRVTGEINKDDFNVMRNEMPKLKYLDLREVKCAEDKIPNFAFGQDFDNPNYPSANIKISTIILPNSIRTIGKWAFSGCTSLSGILKIPNEVTTIGEAAYNGCTGFSGDLKLPNNLKRIENWAFRACTGLNGSLIFPDGLHTIGEAAFHGCSEFTGDLIIPDGVTRFNMAIFKDCYGFDGILKFSNKLSWIDYFAFEGCKNIKGKVYLPITLTDIEMGAFLGCNSVEAFRFANVKPFGNRRIFPNDYSTIIEVPSEAVGSYRSYYGSYYKYIIRGY